MPLSGSAFWAIVIPVGDRANIISQSPSFERGTQGWGTIQAGTIGTTSGKQQFGAWAGSYAPTSNGTTGAMSPTFVAGDGTRYTYSAYINGQAGIPYKLGVGDSNGANLVGTTDLTGGGTWQRYSGTWVESGGATRRVVIKKGGNADTGVVYIDGVQVEVDHLSTYIDGDQDGCIWLGAPHASQSLRSGTYRGGGTVIALADLGLKPHQTPGVGMPPQDVTLQSYALQPGAEYQRSRAGERPFSITFQPILGTTQQHFHIVRRVLENAIKPDLVSPQQPVRLWYTGGQGTVQIDAVYQSGMEFGDLNGPMAEEGAVKFIATDPYWYSTTQEGTALITRQSIGSTNNILKRSPIGVWGTLGANGSTVDNAVQAMALYNGTLYLGGGFGSTAGTRSGALSFYNTQANTFGTFGGTVDSAGGVNAVTVDPNGTVIFGGPFVNISGLSNTRFIARHANGFATITGGTTNAQINAFAWTGGTLVIGGNQNSVAGTANTGGVLLWRPSGYGSTSNGTFNQSVRGLAVGLDRRVFVVADAIATPGGTTANYVAQYFGSWGTLGQGLLSTGAAGGGGGACAAVGPNGVLYVGGGFGSAGGGSAQNVAQWPGQQWLKMSYGLGVDTPGGLNVTAMYADQLTGDVYAAGNGIANSGERVFPDSMGKWQGYIWLPLDADLPTSAAINAFLMAPDRTMYVAGAFSGTSQVAGVTTLINRGMSEACPTIKLRNISGVTIRLYQLTNPLTGDAMYFDTTFEPGEELTLTTEAGNRTFSSSFSNNLFGQILPGSSWLRLVPGTNYLSAFCDSGSVAASIYWQPRSDAIDGGTIY